MTLNFNLSIAKSKAFISVPKCIRDVNLVKIHLIPFNYYVNKVWDTCTHGRKDAWTGKKHNIFGHTARHKNNYNTNTNVTYRHWPIREVITELMSSAKVMTRSWITDCWMKINNKHYCHYVCCVYNKHSQQWGCRLKLITSGQLSLLFLRQGKWVTHLPITAQCGKIWWCYVCMLYCRNTCLFANLTHVDSIQHDALSLAVLFLVWFLLKQPISRGNFTYGSTNSICRY